MTNRKIDSWVIPPQADAEFVASMENVLETYAKPYEPTLPVVCMDETSKQLVAETRDPAPAKPGQPRRFRGRSSRGGEGFRGREQRRRVSGGCQRPEHAAAANAAHLRPARGG